MRNWKNLIAWIAVLVLVTTGLLVAQGGFTLEGLSEKIAELLSNQDDISQRQAVLERRTAPTETGTPIPQLRATVRTKETPTQTATANAEATVRARHTARAATMATAGARATATAKALPTAAAIARATADAKATEEIRATAGPAETARARATEEAVIQPQAQTVFTTSKQIMTDYAWDEQAADRKYVGATVEVLGIIDSISVRATGEYIIDLKGLLVAVVSCTLVEGQEVLLADLAKGDPVIVRGRGSRTNFRGDFQISTCLIVESP